MYVIVGLGNPGKEYENTRHNTGRIILNYFRKKIEADEFSFDKRLNAIITKGKLAKEELTLLSPETFMNKSGLSVKPLITSIKKAHNLIVIHDDLDLAIGSMKISFNRGTGGHRGLDSIVKQIKTNEFIRFRIGISPKTPTGKIKKPSGDVAVEKCILGQFRDIEEVELKKISKKAYEALEILVKDGLAKAMGKANQS